MAAVASTAIAEAMVESFMFAFLSDELARWRRCGHGSLAAGGRVDVARDRDDVVVEHERSRREGTREHPAA